MLNLRKHNKMKQTPSWTKKNVKIRSYPETWIFFYTLTSSDFVHLSSAWPWSRWSVSHGILNYAVFVTIFCECVKPRETAYRWRCSSCFPSHWTWRHHCITLEKMWTQPIRGRETPAKEKQEGCVWGLFNSCETLRRAMYLILSPTDERRGSKNKKLSTLPSP